MQHQAEAVKRLATDLLGNTQLAYCIVCFLFCFCMVWYALDYFMNIECIVHGSKNGLLWYNLTYFGA